MITASMSVKHHGCITERLTGEARAAQISADQTGDVLVMHADDEARVDEFTRALVADQPRPPTILSRSPRSVVVRVTNPPEGVVSRILATGCTIAWPATYGDGLEHYRVLAPSRAHLEAAVRRVQEVGDVRLTHVNDAPNETLDIATTIGGLVSDLTKKQLAILRAAIAAGYYATPRRVTTGELAKQLGIGQTTLSEHLRKAEGRLMERFAELLAFAPLLAAGATRTVGRPKRKPGARPGAKDR